MPKTANIHGTEGYSLTEVLPFTLADWSNETYPSQEDIDLGLGPLPYYTGTLGWLIEQYQTDPMSSFHKLRYHVRQNHGSLMGRIKRDFGRFLLKDIRARELKEWHAKWLGNGRVSSAHALIAGLRTLSGFGIVLLEETECERLALVLSKMKFPQGSQRTEILTAEMVIAHRKKAHWRGWPSMALAQAFQFETMFRQKDIIGEWIPLSEPDISDVANKKYGKWGKGIRWEEIDQNFVLRHTTSKKNKPIEIDLKNSPMVFEEFALMLEKPVEQITRSDLPSGGPIILNEITAWPWAGNEFRRKWRLVANLAGIPKTVRNQDTRAGAITEATQAGAELEHVKHAATHSDISQTQRYSRNATDKTALVQRKRMQHRYRTGG